MWSSVRGVWLSGSHFVYFARFICLRQLLRMKTGIRYQCVGGRIQILTVLSQKKTLSLIVPALCVIDKSVQRNQRRCSPHFVGFGGPVPTLFTSFGLSDCGSSYWWRRFLQRVEPYVTTAGTVPKANRALGLLIGTSQSTYRRCSFNKRPVLGLSPPLKFNANIRPILE